MTMQDIERLETPMLTPAQVGAALGIDPNTIRWQAHREPEKLGFAVVVAKSRVKIPRLPFLKFMRGEEVPRQ